MRVFDNFIEVDGQIVNNQWVEWFHFMIPNKPEWFRSFMRNLMAIFKHCLRCSALDGCYFVSWNIPQNPVPDSNGLLHPNCDCELMEIEFSKVKKNAKAECDIEKFSEYTFSEERSKGKKDLFESWGYSINDSEILSKEYKEQALKQYLLGNYKLKKLDKYGQRLAIPTTLKGHTFYSGWMLYPEGRIVNTTTFGGKINEKK